MASFTPDSYNIVLEPDLAHFAFRGQVTICGRMEGLGDEVILNAAELDVRACGLRTAAGLAECDIVEAPKRQELVVRLPHRLEGPAEITLEYTGILNDRMAGFYRSGYRVGGEERFVATTQFEENDARRAFPCLDHPSRKATFDIEMIVEQGVAAISNMPVRSDEPAGAGRRRVRFATTPAMSTYLVFFGVGAFESLTSPDDPRVRALSVAGGIRHAGFAAAVAASALRSCERAFATPYPLPKLDLIAVPDFAFGAMENWGAITFRENLLLHVAGVTSRAQEQRICEVVAHEIAHQWFGDLVTPADWKYLWLNESFATLFGYRVVDELHPEWRVWDQFLGGSTDAALARDAMRDAPAIEIAGDEPVVINASNAPVLYSKGAAVLRQVEEYVGDEGFSRGLARYLREHRCGTATSRDLWAALDAESSRPVTAMMESWIGQAGHPLVTVELRGADLLLRQSRFTFLPEAARQLWMIPIRVLVFDADGGERTVETLLTRDEQLVALGRQPRAYKLNAGQTGFYRVRYARAEDLRPLEELVAAGRLAAKDRWGLQNDVFALARGCEVAIGEYLRHLQAYGDETAPLPAAAIADNLLHAWLVLGASAGEPVAAWGRLFLHRLLQATGLEPAAGEPAPVSLLRGRILLPAAQLGVEAALDLGRRRLADLAAGSPVPADIRQAVMQVGAWAGGRDELGRLTALYRRADSEQERLNLLQALGCLPGRPLLEEALELAIAEVPSRNRYLLICAAAGNPRSFDWMWDWWRAHLAELEQLHRMHQERVIASIVPHVRPDRAAEVAESLAVYARERRDLAQTAALALERLQINQRMRARSS